MNRILVERKELRKGDVLQAGPFLLRFMPAPGILNITVEVAAGWQIEATGPEAAAADVSEAQSFEVFWEKRKRESGKITDETVLHPRGRRRLGKAVACWMPTLDLRQPWRPAWFVWGGLVALVFGLSALAAWHGAYSPGKLASPHATATLANRSVANRASDGSCSACTPPSPQSRASASLVIVSPVSVRRFQQRT
jgi:hypothetical protein